MNLYKPTKAQKEHYETCHKDYCGECSRQYDYEFVNWFVKNGYLQYEDHLPSLPLCIMIEGCEVYVSRSLRFRFNSGQWSKSYFDEEEMMEVIKFRLQGGHKSISEKEALKKKIWVSSKGPIPVEDMDIRYLLNCVRLSYISDKWKEIFKSELGVRGGRDITEQEHSKCQDPEKPQGVKCRHYTSLQCSECKYGPTTQRKDPEARCNLL